MTAGICKDCEHFDDKKCACSVLNRMVDVIVNNEPVLMGPPGNTLVVGPYFGCNSFEAIK